MMKTTQKDIRGFFPAEDMTHYSFDEVNNILALEGTLDTICYSAGAYGINGAVLKGFNTGTLYKITTRSTALFQVL